MLSKEDNELLTQTGPGTPMGNLFRRFWLPALLSSELPGPDCVPVRVRILGEDLIAFRDTNGRVGVFDAYCPHRNAPLFFGRNEEAGLRCVYHGWKFDVDGNCVDMPNCVEGEEFKNRVQVLSYPVYERGGWVWLYMGARERQPPYPAMEFLDWPESHWVVNKTFMDCNYLQELEGNLDLSHSSFLHSTFIDNNARNPFNAATGNTGPVPRNRVPRYEVVDTDYGAVQATSRVDENGQRSVGTALQWLMPTGSLGGALRRPGQYSFNMRIPVDDTHLMVFSVLWSEEPLPQDQRNRNQFVAQAQQVPGTFRAAANKDNDYLIDRNMQRFFNFTGIANTPLQDQAMVENQRGPLMDRSRETLVSDDRYIIHVRQRLLKAAKALMEGQDPPEVWNPDAFRVRGGRVVVAGETPIEEAVREIARPRPRRTEEAAVVAS